MPFFLIEDHKDNQRFIVQGQSIMAFAQELAETGSGTVRQLTDEGGIVLKGITFTFTNPTTRVEYTDE